MEMDNSAEKYILDIEKSLFGLVDGDANDVEGKKSDTPHKVTPTYSSLPQLNETIQKLISNAGATEINPDDINHAKDTGGDNFDDFVVQLKHGMFSCLRCNKIYQNHRTAIQHFNAVHTVCDASAQYLPQQQSSKPKFSIKDSLNCKVCQTLFSDEIASLIKPSNKISCPICSRDHVDRTALFVHMDTTNHLKVYHQKHDKKTLKIKPTMKTPVAISCEECQIDFTSAVLYEEHLVNVHADEFCDYSTEPKDEEDWQFVCPECHIEFLSFDTYQYHMAKEHNVKITSFHFNRGNVSVKVLSEKLRAKSLGVKTTHKEVASTSHNASDKTVKMIEEIIIPTKKVKTSDASHADNGTFPDIDCTKNELLKTTEEILLSHINIVKPPDINQANSRLENSDASQENNVKLLDKSHVGNVYCCFGCKKTFVLERLYVKHLNDSKECKQKVDSMQTLTKSHECREIASSQEKIQPCDQNQANKNKLPDHSDMKREHMKITEQALRTRIFENTANANPTVISLPAENKILDDNSSESVESRSNGMVRVDEKSTPIYVVNENEILDDSNTNSSIESRSNDLVVTAVTVTAEDTNFSKGIRSSTNECLKQMLANARGIKPKQMIQQKTNTRSSSPKQIIQQITNARSSSPKQMIQPITNARSSSPKQIIQPKMKNVYYLQKKRRRKSDPIDPQEEDRQLQRILEIIQREKQKRPEDLRGKKKRNDSEDKDPNRKNAKFHHTVRPGADVNKGERKRKHIDSMSNKGISKPPKVIHIDITESDEVHKSQYCKRCRIEFADAYSYDLHNKYHHSAASSGNENSIEILDGNDTNSSFTNSSVEISLPIPDEISLPTPDKSDVNVIEKNTPDPAQSDFYCIKCSIKFDDEYSFLSHMSNLHPVVIDPTNFIDDDKNGQNLEITGVTTDEDITQSIENPKSDVPEAISSVSKSEASSTSLGSSENLCDTCGIVFPLKEALDLHLKKNHVTCFQYKPIVVNSAGKVYSCLVCQKTFAIEQSYVQHMTESIQCRAEINAKLLTKKVQKLQQNVNRNLKAGETSTGKVYDCFGCKKTFEFECLYIEHLMKSEECAEKVNSQVGTKNVDKSLTEINNDSQVKDLPKIGELSAESFVTAGVVVVPEESTIPEDSVGENKSQLHVVPQLHVIEPDKDETPQPAQTTYALPTGSSVDLEKVAHLPLGVIQNIFRQGKRQEKQPASPPMQQNMLFSCNECKVDFVTENTYNYHMKTTHFFGAANKPSMNLLYDFSCHTCKVEFETKSMYVSHMRGVHDILRPIIKERILIEPSPPHVSTTAVDDVKKETGNEVRTEISIVISGSTSGGSVQVSSVETSERNPSQNMIIPITEVKHEDNTPSLSTLNNIIDDIMGGNFSNKAEKRCVRTEEEMLNVQPIVSNSNSVPTNPAKDSNSIHKEIPLLDELLGNAFSKTKKAEVKKSSVQPKIILKSNSEVTNSIKDGNYLHEDTPKLNVIHCNDKDKIDLQPIVVLDDIKKVLQLVSDSEVVRCCQCGNSKNIPRYDSSKYYVCSYCMDASLTYSLAKEVLHNIENEDEELVCCLCLLKFTRRNNLVNHIKLHKAPRFACRICKKVFLKIEELQDHFQKHNSKVWLPENFGQFSGTIQQCKLCPMVFRNAKDIPCHMNLYHKGELPFSCSVCKESFWTGRQMRMHSPLHSKRRYDYYKSDYYKSKNFTCQVCQRTYISATLLDKHMVDCH